MYRGVEKRRTTNQQLERRSPVHVLVLLDPRLGSERRAVGAVTPVYTTIRPNPIMFGSYRQALNFVN